MSSHSASAVITPATVSPWRGRLVVLAGLLLIGLNSRIMVAVVAPIIGLIRQDVPISRSDEGVIGLLAPLCFAVFGAISPALGRRLGLEALMIGALAVSGIGELYRALIHTPAQFIIWSIPALVGAGVGNVIVPPLIKKYFPDRVGAVTAIYTFFTTLSTALPPLFILNIATTTGWRFSVGVWAIIGFCGVIPWLMVVFSSERAGERLSAVRRRLDPRVSAPRPHRLPVHLSHTPLAWAMTAVFAVNCIIGYTAFAWLPQVFVDAGITQARADFYLGLFTAGSLPGALITPILVARMKRTWILPVVFFTAYLISFLALSINPAHLTLTWILLSRVGDCFFPYILTMINLRTRTTRGSIAMSGFVQPVGYTIAVIGPWGFGMLHTLVGNWHIPMLALVACLPLQLIGGIVMARSKPLDI
ncbi:MAG: MFS transporter [Propionibacteriaceae bacterium]|nr:MFS transporter [Propionibacteriaceae bacterium]